MSENRRQKLVALGVDALADALLALAAQSEANDDWVNHLVATPAENRNRFKKKLSQLLRSQRFIQGNKVHDFAEKLRAMLRDLEIGTDSPWLSLQALAAFIEADEAIMEHCDDSVGWVADVFELDAKDVFVTLASRCEDKERVAQLVLRLCEHDPLWIRKKLVDSANQYLPETILRSMIDVFQQRSEAEEEAYLKRRVNELIASLARQLSDGRLFERTQLASWGTLSPKSLCEVAEVYLASGDIQTALEKLKGIGKEGSYPDYRRDQLLLDIYTQLGDSEQCAVILHRQFRACPTEKGLLALLDVVGHNQRDAILEEEMGRFLDSPKLRIAHVEFLLEMARIDEAERYLLDRIQQIDGEDYITLPRLAESLESKKRYLVAAMLYRALLTSILDRGYTRAYHHGIRYLKHMDRLAAKVIDWQGYEDHDSFLLRTHNKHRRKRSFWSKYERNLNLLRQG